MIPTFTLKQSEIRTWKWSAAFLGVKRVSHSIEEPSVGAALRKFDSSDSNKRFWQRFTNVKIRKTKIWGLEELKMFSRFAEERTLNIYQS